MFLCFFALSANMSANLYKQTKELAVLRAIGFTNLRLKLLYFYEAMIIVLASSLTGVVIGMTVSFTMVMQENVLLGRDLQLFFPLSQFVVILVLSIICAFMATYVPAS
jgi:ABC-type antimicrobial peptide transport system permease subunit